MFLLQSTPNGASGAAVAKLVVVVKRKEQGHVKILHLVKEKLRKRRHARHSLAVSIFHDNDDDEDDDDGNNSSTLLQ